MRIGGLVGLILVVLLVAFLMENVAIGSLGGVLLLVLIVLLLAGRL